MSSVIRHMVRRDAKQADLPGYACSGRLRTGAISDFHNRSRGIYVKLPIGSASPGDSVMLTPQNVHAHSPNVIPFLQLD